MQIEGQKRDSKRDTVLPMINVVFLLLVFFVMLAEIAPPAPFAVDLPQAAGADGLAGEVNLFMSAEGAVAFADLSNDAALLALSETCGTGACKAGVNLRADRAASGQAVAALLARLKALGVETVHLVTVAP